MVKTGNSILELFSIVAIVLPLLPLLLILLKRLYDQPVMQLLGLVCLSDFAEYFLYRTNNIYIDRQMITELSRTVDCALLLLLFRISASSKRLAELFYFLLISSVSIVIAVYATNGTEKFAFPVSHLQSILLILSALLLLIQMVNSRTHFLFEMPLFWICAATFFYYSMYLLIEKITVPGVHPLQNTASDKQLLSHLAHFMRYILYIIAVIITHQPSGNQPASKKDVVRSEAFR